MIRFKTDRMWKGERVRPGDPVNGTDKEKQAMLECGQAYNDEMSYPTMENTKKEIELWLDENDIPYDEYATKSELIECLQQD